MDTTDTDFQDGERRDVTATYVLQRDIECDGDTVQRLVVADDAGTRHTLFVVPQRSPIEHLEPGQEYEFRGVVGSRPIDATGTGLPSCPQCGEQLREGRAVDGIDPTVATASTMAASTVPFGIIDERTTITPTENGDTPVDDWQPRSDTRDVAVPDYVCDACERHVASYELAGGHPDAEVEMLENQAPASPSGNAAGTETVGLAAGGAKDVTNFRDNITNGYTPQPEAISDEGLFYDYYFETGEPTDTTALFAPRYAAGVSDHPLSGETEQYLSVGLDSTLSVEAFDRPRLDLVAVLDVSGSMESRFDAYYYDEHGRKRAVEDGSGAETKLAAATRALCALTEQLREGDRLGVVLYNHRAHVAKPLRDVATTDMEAIRGHIREIAAGGGTNMEDGFEAALDMLADGTTDADCERRVVFMTDMMPNTGATGEDALTSLFADAAMEGIHTTFVGSGLDANAELADALSGIRGGNHYFVHSAAQFEQRLSDEFDYMVTPLVYDLTLELDADGYEVEAIHGSPSADAARAQLMHVGTLFPSAKQDGGTRGGVVLVRLEQHRPDADLDLVASWTERDGSDRRERVSVRMPETPETFARDGVRKAVALARYARELRTWAQEIHARPDRATGVDDWLLFDQRGNHERESVPLVVPDEYADRFIRLRTYLEAEREAVTDDALEREVALLDTLCQEASASPEVSE